MAIVIQTPKGPVTFPDGTPPDAIKAAIQKSNNFQAAETAPAAEVQQPQVNRPRGGRGYSAASIPQESGPGTIMGPATQGVTMGMGDEIMGVGAMFGNFFNQLMGTDLKDSGITGESFSPYEATRDAARGDIAAFTERNPKTAMAAEIAGGVLTGGAGGSRVLAKEAAQKVPQTLAKISALSGGQGAAYGFGTGEGMEDSLQRGITQGVQSAIAGPIIQKGLGALMKPLTKKSAAAAEAAQGPKNTIASLKNESQAFYKAAEESGVRIKPAPYKRFADNLIEEIDNTGVTGSVRAPISKSLKEIAALKNPSYRDLEKAKIMLGSAKLNADEATRTYANKISNDIDSFVDDLKFGDVQKGSKISQLGPNLKKAKDLWSRKANAETLESIEEAALDSAQAAKGNMDQALSSAARPYIKRGSKKSFGLDDEVQAGLRDMIRGTSAKKFARSAAEVAPGSGSARGLQATAGAGLIGVAAGGPIGVLAAAIPGITGEAAKRLANKLTKREFAKLENMVLNKGRKEASDFANELMNKYGGTLAGIASGAAASGSEATGLADIENAAINDMR